MGGDTFSWTDGTTTIDQNTIFGGYGIGMSHNQVANFGTASNHAIGDNWSFTINTRSLDLMNWSPFKQDLYDRGFDKRI